MTISTVPFANGKTTIVSIPFGAMGIGGAFYGAADTDEERFKVLDRLLELGVTTWDTASVYGDSEELIGKWFARTGKRDKIFLATKFGFAPDYSIHGDPEFIKQEFATSLKRLQTNYIDLYYQHRVDGTVPIETTVSTIAEFVKEGKIKYIGLSEASPDTIRRANKVHPISALQVEYSPFDTSLEQPGGNIALARELGITVFAYSPTGRGLASGRYKSPNDFEESDFRRMVPKFSEKNFPHILKLVDGLKEIATAHKATTSQIALAWVLAQPGIVPIQGSKQLKYIDENTGAADIKLTDEEIKKIRALNEEVEGKIGADGRYPGAFLDQTKVETPPLK